MFNESSMFGKDFKYIMSLTVLAWVAYTLPSFHTMVAGDSSMNVAAASVASANVKNTIKGTLVTPSLKMQVAGKLRSEYKIGQNLQAKLKLMRSDGKPATQEDHFSVAAASYYVSTDMKTPDGSSISTKVSYLGNGNWMVSRPVPSAAGKYYLRIMGGCYYEGTCAPGYDSWVSSVEARLPYTVRGEIAATSSAVAMISVDASSPMQSIVSTPDASSNQYLGLPLLVFDVKAVNNSILLKNVDVQFNVSSGSGSLTNAYLYQYDTMIASAPVINGVASFSLAGQNGILVNATQPFAVKVDVTAIGSEGISVSANVDASGVYAQDISGLDATASGSANGSVIQIVSGAAMVSDTFSQVGSPIMTGNVVVGYPFSFKFNLSAGNSTVYISSTASMVMSVASANIGVNYANVSATPSQMAGDGQGYYVIPAGSSRAFTLNGVATSAGVPGSTSVEITQIYYGLSATDVQSHSIGQGLGALKVLFNL